MKDVRRLVMSKALDVATAAASQTTSAATDLVQKARDFKDDVVEDVRSRLEPPGDRLLIDLGFRERDTVGLVLPSFVQFQVVDPQGKPACSVEEYAYPTSHGLKVADWGCGCHGELRKKTLKNPKDFFVEVYEVSLTGTLITEVRTVTFKQRKALKASSPMGLSPILVASDTGWQMGTSAKLGRGGKVVRPDNTVAATITQQQGILKEGQVAVYVEDPANISSCLAFALVVCLERIESARNSERNERRDLLFGD